MDKTRELKIAGVQNKDCWDIYLFLTIIILYPEK